MNSMHILVALDLKGDPHAVMQCAAAQAKATGGMLHLVHVTAPTTDYLNFREGAVRLDEPATDGQREEKMRLDGYVQDLAAQGVKADATLVLGLPVEAILREADRTSAAMIIMGTRGRQGIAKAFLGSTSQEVLRTNKYQVLIVPMPLQD